MYNAFDFTDGMVRGMLSRLRVVPKKDYDGTAYPLEFLDDTEKYVYVNGTDKVTAEQLLDGWTFESGMPCGVRTSKPFWDEWHTEHTMEDGFKYLVTIRDVRRKVKACGVYVGTAIWFSGMWYTDGQDTLSADDVVAWMALPTPYFEEESDKDGCK